MKQITVSYNVLYDADCGFCDWCRRCIERWSPPNTFNFIDIKSKSAHSIAQTHHKHIDDENILSFVACNQDGWLEQWATVRAISAYFSGSTRGIYYLSRIIPTPIGNIIYRCVARNRHRISTLIGKNTCSLK